MIIAICDGAKTPKGVACGIVIFERIGASQNGQRISPHDTQAKMLSNDMTSNDAEWNAIHLAQDYVLLRDFKGKKTGELFIYTDSQLVAYVINGKYRARQENIIEHFVTYKEKLAKLQSKGITSCVQWLPRQLTHLADKVAEKALK